MDLSSSRWYRIFVWFADIRRQWHHVDIKLWLRDYWYPYKRNFARRDAKMLIYVEICNDCIHLTVVIELSNIWPRVAVLVKKTYMRYITVTSWWARWCLKSPTWPLFTEPLVQVQIKEIIKSPRHWPLWGRNTPVTGESPAQRASKAGNVSIWWRHHEKLFDELFSTFAWSLTHPQLNLRRMPSLL